MSVNNHLHTDTILNALTTTPVIVTDAQGTILFFNKGAENKLGYTCSEVVNKLNLTHFLLDFELLDLAENNLTQPSPTTLFAILENKVVQASPCIEQLTVSTKDEKLWKCQLILNKEAHGNYVVMLHDMTQIKARKDDLIIHHNFLKGVLQTTPDLIYVYDLREESLVYSNRIYDNKFALDQAPFLPLDQLKSVIHPDDLSQLIAYRQGLVSLKKGEIDFVEYRIKTKEGSYAWLLAKDVVFTQEASGEVTQVLGLARDITEIKEANQKLLQSEALYRAVINTQQEILCRFLPDTTLTFVNEAYCQFFNKTADDLINTPFLEMVPAENHASVKKRLKKIAQEKRPITQEYKVMVEDQTEDIWLRWTDYPIFDEKGQLVEFQSVGLEITDRKRVEIELQEQKQMLESILNTLPIHVFIKDENSRLLFVNQTMLDFLRKKPEQLIGKTDAEIFPSKVADKFFDDDELLKKGDLPDNWEEEIEVDNHRHFFRTGKCLIPLPMQNTHYLLGYSFEITPLKETQLQLHESEAKYRLIANNTNDLICLHTYEGFFSYISPSVEGLTGYKDGEMMHQKVIEWVYEEDQAYVISVWHKVLKSRALQILEYRFKHKNGELVWLETHLFPVYDDAGKLKHVQGNTRNITERKQSEFTLKQTRDYLIEVLDHIPDPVFVKNERYEFISVNEAYCELVGKPREQVLLKTDYDIFASEDAHTLREKDSQVFSTGNTAEYQRVITNLNGEKRHILVKIDIFRDDKNQKVLVGVIRDITQQKTAEERLANNERSLKAILTSFNDIVFEINQNLIFTNFWGDKDKLFFDDQDFLGKKVTKVMDDPMRSYFASSLRHVLDNKTSKIIEYPSVQNGVKSWYSCTINYLPETSERQAGVSVLVTDVTSHKTAQRRLRQSEEQLQDFLDNASILIQSVDLEGTVHYVNKYWCKKLGYSKAEALRTNLIDLVVPEEQEDYRALLQHLKTEGGAQQISTRLITKDGKTLMLEGSINIRKDGKPLLTRSFLQDVTERNQAERAILEQNRLFEAFLENSPIGIQIYDKQGFSLQMNDAQKRILGLDSQETPKFNILQDERSQEAGLDFFYKAAYGGESIFLPRLETELVIKEEEGKAIQKEVCLNLIIFPIKNDYNEVEGVVTFTQDVSEQFTIEQELNESRYFIKSIADAIPNDVYVYDLEQERYVYTNTQYFKHSGFTIKEVDRGGLERIWDMIHPNDLPEIKAIFEEVYKGGEDMYEMSYRLACNLNNKKGKTHQSLDPTQLHQEGQKYVWVYDRLVPFKINVEGRVTQILGVVQNITDSKNFEEELIQAKQDAEKALQAKEQFLSTMSHEIRTPMNAVIGITHLLLEEDHKPEQLENLKTLKFSAENLLALINDILDYNKIEAGKISFERVDFNLREFINNIKHAFNYQAAEKGIELEFYVERDVPNLLIGDPVRLNQILTNLLGNAIKFTDKGFVVVKVQLQETLPDKQNIPHQEVSLLFSVKDSGIGIAPDKQSTIFERFTQADSDTTRRFGGTGLGLSITKYLIEHQGGEIGLHSELGKGSEFYFFLNFQVSKLKHLNGIISENQSNASSNLGNVVLLLVEDRKINRMVASKFLRRWGVEVDFAYNGEEAVKKVQTRQYDIILMDLLMPKMDGFAAARKIRNLAHYQDTPIIALSASTLSQEREKAFAVQMNDFVSKPFNPNELYHKIIKYVNKSSANLLSDQNIQTPEEPAMDTESYYNLSNVDDICQDDQEMRLELIRTFVDELTPAINNFTQAALAYNPEPMKVVVHNLKSSSVLFGTEKLLGALTEVRELSLNNASQNKMIPLIDQINRMVQYIVAGLKKEI
ncbi:PAS domain S-box protein [Microscilla marina]|uniref:PAS domain S-box protein n=1 Tax=Microscilla marina TaxID=1027 RepID=UPI0002F16AF6|nr:PAS domain S-box protein [Microscilla marina]